MEGDFSYMELLASVEKSQDFTKARPEFHFDNSTYEVGFPNAENSSPFVNTDENLCMSGLCNAEEEEASRVISECDSLEGEYYTISEGEEDDLLEQDYDPGVSEKGNEDGIYLLDDTSSDEEDEQPKNISPPAVSHEGSNDLQDGYTRTDPIEENSGQKNLGYKKRRRFAAGEERPDCRPPRAIGAVEIAMRASSDRKTDQIFVPVVGTVFDSVEEAYEFYNLYSWEKGFGINYGRCDRNRGNGYKTMQQFHCACEGFDKRCLHQSQRCGCNANIRILRTDDHGWYVSRFEEDHNHKLSECYGEKMNWGSHRRIDESAKNMIKYLRDNNVPLGKVHSIMGSIYGSVKDLPFTKRSLRTVCQQLAREQMDNDVRKTLDIFRKMRLEDPDFAYSVDVDKQNRIKTLIWTNHRSKMQYQCFGDVFTFDTTYCTNIYKMPFGLFVGVNNHFQSVIYAGVLMRREKTKSFVWVFNEFLSLMGGKAPETILTDQCQAMMSALKISMPNTTHLWCKWHVLRKAQESLGPVYAISNPFRPEFHKVINEMLTEDEFEKAWEHLIKKYKLQKNPFMIRIYECRSMWAKPYSKDKFYARMMSTQRSESANHILKTYVRANSSMNNFVEKYNDMMFDRAMEEDREEHMTKLVKKSIKRMWPLQNHASKIYTRATFKLFTAELEKSYHFVVVQHDDSTTFFANHCYPELREPWVRISFNVTAEKESGIFHCECGLFTHFGILCCHAIRIMNYLGVAQIPKRYILKRWTRDARDVLPDNMRFLQKDSRSLKSHTFRDSLLYATAMKAVKTGNQNMDTFTEMMKHLGNGIRAVQDIVAARGDTVHAEDVPHYESSDNECNRVQRAGYQSEPDLVSKGRQIYSHARGGAVKSNFDISKLKGPLIPKQSSGRQRFRRFFSPIESKSKGKKKYVPVTPGTRTSIKQTSFCSICRLSGHKRNKCPQNQDPGKNTRKPPCCSNCKLPGISNLVPLKWRKLIRVMRPDSLLPKGRERI